jgi:Zn-dependent protease with chaperone function
LAVLLAAALLMVVCTAALQLLTALPIAAAAESLPDENHRLAARFWAISSLLSPTLATILTAVALLTPMTGGLSPHLERTRPHLCWLRLTEGPDAAWHFRLASAMTAALLLFGVVRFVWRLVSSARVARLARAMLAKNTTKEVLILSSQEPYCFSVGTRDGVVVISQGLAGQLDTDQLRALLAHEQEHISRHDNLWHLILELAATVAIPVPLGFWYAHRWRSAAEAACDLAAVDATGRDTVVALLELMDRQIGELHHKRTGALTPVYRAGMSPQQRAERLRRVARPSVAPALKLVLAAEIGLAMVVVAFTRQWLWDSLYCAGDSLVKVMGHF